MKFSSHPRYSDPLFIRCLGNFQPPYYSNSPRLFGTQELLFFPYNHMILYWRRTESLHTSQIYIAKILMPPWIVHQKVNETTFIATLTSASGLHNSDQPTGIPKSFITFQRYDLLIRQMIIQYLTMCYKILQDY